MKTQVILALSLISSTAIAAQEKQASANDCCSPSPCVTTYDPCCYPPAYYGLDCSCGFTVDVDFLWWLVRETNLPFAGEAKVVSRNSTIPGVLDIAVIDDLNFLDSEWDPGFRVGLGWLTGCNCWDLYASWTYFLNKSSNSLNTSFAGFQPVLGESGVVSPWFDVNAQNASPASGFIPLFEKVSAKWRLYYNQVDLLLGKKYWLDPCFNLKLNAGLRGYWIRTKFKTEGTQGPKDIVSPFTVTDFQNEDSIFWKTTQWGVGILMGLQPNWYFCSNFLLFGNADFSIGWGRFDQRVDEAFFMAGIGGADASPELIGPFTIINLNNSFNQCVFSVNTFIDLALGFRWEEFWCCNSYYSALDVAWEQHILFDVASRLISLGSTNIGDANSFSGFINNTGNLVFGGLVVRASFGF